MSAMDPYDIDIDPRVDPSDLNTASFLNHKNIFVPLKRILANPSYLASAKEQLKLQIAEKKGLAEANQSEQEREMQKQRLRVLGAEDLDNMLPTDTIVELTRSYKMIRNEQKQKFVRHLIIFAMDSIVLYNLSLIHISEPTRPY